MNIFEVVCPSAIITLRRGRWRMTQRWNDAVRALADSADEMARLPGGIKVDTFDGYAWIGVVPFWMDQVPDSGRRRAMHYRSRHCTFCELSLRTYVRSPTTDLRESAFSSLDAASALAVIGARTFFHLPYFLASMHSRIDPDGMVEYSSNAFLTSRSVAEARYRGLSEVAGPSRNGTLEVFSDGRLLAFTQRAGRVLRRGHPSSSLAAWGC
jgi:uncharacterized protein YqjF (DUF2071 family)